jgi:hypothetical protein
MLSFMGTKLYKFYFEGKMSLREIRDEIATTTRYELAVGESESTMNSKKLAKQFTVVYQGEPISIETHLKLGSDPRKLIRIYYGVDQKKQMLVVGHAGRHLDTSSTN